jgi:hypothetical protein
MLGVDIPYLKFYKDPSLKRAHDFDFGAVEQGSVVEYPFFLRNESEKTVYDLHLVIPKQVVVEPDLPDVFVPGQVFKGRLIWSVGEYMPLRALRANVKLKGRFEM